GRAGIESTCCGSRDRLACTTNRTLENYPLKRTVSALAGTTLGLTALFAAMRIGAAGQTPENRTNPAFPLSEAQKTTFFETEIRPLLKANCYTCHAGSQPSGGLNLTTRAGILQGGLSGPAVTLDKPDESLLVRAIRYE